MKRPALLFAADVDNYIAQQMSRVASSLAPSATCYLMTTDPKASTKISWWMLYTFIAHYQFIYREAT